MDLCRLLYLEQLMTVALAGIDSLYFVVHKILAAGPIVRQLSQVFVVEHEMDERSER